MSSASNTTSWSRDRSRDLDDDDDDDAVSDPFDNEVDDLLFSSEFESLQHLLQLDDKVDCVTTRHDEKRRREDSTLWLDDDDGWAPPSSEDDDDFDDDDDDFDEDFDDDRTMRWNRAAASSAAASASTSAAASSAASAETNIELALTLARLRLCVVAEEKSCATDVVWYVPLSGNVVLRTHSTNLPVLEWIQHCYRALVELAARGIHGDMPSLLLPLYHMFEQKQEAGGSMPPCLLDLTNWASTITPSTLESRCANFWSAYDSERERDIRCDEVMRTDVPPPTTRLLTLVTWSDLLHMAESCFSDPAV